METEKVIKSISITRKLIIDVKEDLKSGKAIYIKDSSGRDKRVKLDLTSSSGISRSARPKNGKEKNFSSGTK